MIRILLVLALGGLLGCSAKNGETTLGNAAKGEYVPEKNIVDTIVLNKRDFHKEIIGNGRLRALRKSDIRFMVNGQIETIKVTNGQYVDKGKILATLDCSEAKLKYEQAQQRFEKAKIDLSDVLIGFGLGTDTTKAPKEKLEVAYVRSGYAVAKSDLTLAGIAISNTVLSAPFSGKIANLNSKVYEQNSGVFCTIIDDACFEADFNILESELSLVRVGQKVRITPFSESGEVYTGVIRDINPMVNQRGQINVRAEIANKAGKLMDGMNVKIAVEEKLSHQLVVPKSAVVMRDGYEVLFRMSEGKAIWTYVKITASNSSSHIIEPNTQKNAEINIGDIIITSGNLNLADGSTVEIKNKQ